MGLPVLRCLRESFRSTVSTTNTQLPQETVATNQPHLERGAMNTIIITGNVTKDPEMRFTQGGKGICTFSVATSWGRDDNKQTTYHDVKVFGDMAENVCASITKGVRVTVHGRLDKQSYERKDGGKGMSVEIVAESVALDVRFRPAYVDQTENTMKQVKANFPNAQLLDEEPF